MRSLVRGLVPFRLPLSQTSEMRKESWRGHWWLPSSPNDRAAGRLVIEDDGSCELQLIGGLDMGEPTSTQLADRMPAIFGEAEGKLISLLDCFVRRQDGFGRRASSYQDIHVHEALIGAHVHQGEEAFQCAIVAMEHLTSWLAIHDAVTREGSHDVEVATTQRPSDRACSVDGWSFTARGLVQPFQTTAERSRLAVTGEVTSYLVIRPPAAVAADAFHEPVLELMDLLTLASGEPSGQIELTLVHKDTIEHPNADGTYLQLEQRVESFGARTHTARPTESAVPDWRFLFTCADISFDEVVPAWLSIRRRSTEACNVFFGMQYARPTFTEVRLLMTAITAETLHQSIRGDVTEFSADAFTDLRARLIASLSDEGEREWVKRQLRNAPSFRERLIALASIPSADAVASVIPDVDEWSRSLRDARNNLAHSGNEKVDDDIFHLESITTSLLSLVLLAELGLSVDIQERAARKILAPDTPVRRSDRRKRASS